MSLAINHNIMASNTANALSAHYGSLASSTRRLSTGLRINSAADDAAGLAIRELQRADIAAFNQGVRNLQDGISMAQYADSTLQQFSSILQRLTELAEQAATGTYDSTQRQIIADEAGELTREIERMQNAANFNGIDLFTKEDSILIHWGKESEDYIPLNLSKLTSSTVGGELDGTNMAYSVLQINGGNLGKAVTGATRQESKATTLADQTISIGTGGNVSNYPNITVSTTNNNNTAEALAADIMALGMDGIRYAKTSSELTLTDWDRSDINGSEGDIVKFTFAVDLEGGGSVEKTGSYLVGTNDTDTAANRQAALKRIVNAINKDNADSDLTLDGDTIRSSSGRTLSVGELEVFEATSVVINNFDNTPATITKSGTQVPNSVTSFTLEGKDISFVSSGNSSTDLDRAYNAVRNAGFSVYDNTRFLTDENYAWPADSDHQYIIKKANNGITVIKLNTSFDTAGDEISVSNIRNNQTQTYLQYSGSTYSGEETTINIDGKDVTFSGSLTNARNAINNAGIANVTAEVDGNRLIIAKTNSETDLKVSYVDDAYTGITFTGLVADSGTGTDASSFFLNGNEISYQHGATATDTANNLAAALGAYGTATVANGRVTFRTNDHDNFYLSNYTSTDPLSALSVSKAAGSSYTGDWAKGITVKDDNVSIQVSSGKGSTGTGTIGRKTTPGGQPANLDSGLLLHYAFEGSTAAGDTAIKQDAAVLVNGATIGADNTIQLIGQSNSAANPTPNGGQYVLLPTLSRSDFTQGLSISIWVNESDILGGDRGESYVELFGGHVRIFHNDTPGNSAGFPTKTVGFGLGNGRVSSSFDMSDRGDWVNYTMTYDGSTLSAYRNGTLVGQTAATFSPESRYEDRNALGSHWWSGNMQSARFVGSMDELRVYDRALTTEEVTALATSVHAAPTTPPSSQTYDPGIIAGPVTTTASKATASVTTLRNAKNGVSSTFDGTTGTSVAIKEGGVDSATARWKDDGVRETGAVGTNPEVGILKSQEHGATADNVWASVAGTSEIYTDPEFAFTFSSSVSGKGDAGGAFYQDAYKAADMDYRTQKANQKTFLTDFVNEAGETISFNLQGVDISYTVPPDSGNAQKDNAWALMDALKNKSAALAAAGISYSISAGEDGVYIFNDKGGPISFSNYSGSAATDSGFTLKNIDNENQYFKLRENSEDPNDELLSAVMKTFTAISQIDYRTQAGAQSALPILKAALNQVSQARADIGAFISVLENQTTAVQIQSQNYQVAESRISDIDVAQEMTAFVRSQILSQAATAMLAQANIIPQMALKLIG